MIDSISTKYPICPYCLCEYKDCIIRKEGEHNIKCFKCEKDIKLTVEVKYTYMTEKID